MRYSGLILNDITAAPGLCVSFFTQGCPHRCPGCHNPDTWAFEGGKQFTTETLNEIIAGLTAQGIQRDVCIMGGEPLCEDNAFLYGTAAGGMDGNRGQRWIFDHCLYAMQRDDGTDGAILF